MPALGPTASAARARPAYPALETSTGLTHSLVVTEAGAVLSFGCGGDGCLGHGDHHDQHTPKLIEALRGERVVAVAAGVMHSLVATETGTVLSFGWGGAGRLGHCDEESQLTPKLIEALRGKRVAAVSAGQAHSLCALVDGRVFGWGRGTDERLGLQLEGDQRTQCQCPTLRF